MILKIFIYSKFCGNSVCNEELIKERADPQNPKVFHPICKICERLYLEKMIRDSNMKKKNTQKLDVEILSKRLKEVESILKKKKNDYEEIKHEVIIKIYKNF